MLGNVVLESLYNVMSEVGECFPVDVFGTSDAQTTLATWGHSWTESGFNWGMQISQIFCPKQLRLRRTLIEKCRRRLPTIPHLYPRAHIHVAAVSGRPPPRTSPWPPRAEAPGPEALTWLRSPCGRFPGFAVTQPHPHAPPDAPTRRGAYASPHTVGGQMVVGLTI